MRKIILCLAAALALSLPAGAQTKMIRDFKPAADSLKARMERRNKVRASVRISKIMDRGGVLDFYFTSDFAEYPWHEGDYEWVTKEFKKLFPSAYSNYELGDLYGDRKLIRDLQMPLLTSDGKPRQNSFRVRDQRSKTIPLVSVVDGPVYEKGLSGRHISIWQSHGRYFDPDAERWRWQRAPLHGTMEDIFTQSFVLPFLIPMLENSGAVVLTPRERDTQPLEIVCDNDPSFEGPRERPLRQAGVYQEKGSWVNAGIGFADKKEVYAGEDNPFEMGTARSIGVQNNANASIRWTAMFEESGKYAVYVSYKTLSNSTTCASYTVHHAGGETRFAVNQTMAGGTWVYLGTFEFRKGRSGWVELDNGVPKGSSFKENTVVSADAVRFGGGMGKIDRGAGISGLPCYEEGALYSLLWGGMSLSYFDWETEYQREYGSRAIWVNNMSGGSRVNPNGRGRGVPFDLSLAFHSNAGVKDDGYTYGTLSIVHSERAGKTHLPSGESRQSSRMMADLMQTQIVDDMRSLWLPGWTRMTIYDRGYHEASAPVVPAMILEAFSHQNFTDMTFGLDPAFRFDFSRSVYKGILKYLSYRYGCSYVVQPLPVKNFSVTLGKNGKAQLRWEAVNDPLEPTARASSYILYTREDDEGFDGGVELTDVHKDGAICTAEVSVKKGHLYSFRIAAANDGGRSFPSEVLCVGIPEDGNGHNVLVVNNFTRVSAPVWVNLPSYGGFMYTLDGGVAWGEDISYAGEVYLFEKGIPWADDDNPGSGGCFTDHRGIKFAGNTFDFVATHARSLMKAGCTVTSTASGALTAADTTGVWALDIICGKQVTTPCGLNRAHKDRYEVFPADFRGAIARFASNGCHLLLSGAYIGTDAWDKLYPIEKKSDEVREAIKALFGYKWLTNYGDRSGTVRPYGRTLNLPETRYNREYNMDVYRVENADGIGPAGKQSTSVMRYRSTDISAAVAFDSGTYRALSFGFPLETVVSDGSLDDIIKGTCEYFDSFVKQ